MKAYEGGSTLQVDFLCLSVDLVSEFNREEKSKNEVPTQTTTCNLFVLQC